MLKEELEILKADFKDWLSHPLTNTFIKLISKQKDDYREYGNQNTFNSYYKKELSEQSILAFGKADGIQTILDMVESCKADPEVINHLFQQTFEINEKN